MKPKMNASRALGRSAGFLALALSGLLVAAPAVAAPPGTVPFGAYDPEGTFIDDPVPIIEHVFLPWEDVFLPSLTDADAYALARNRALLITLEPWTWSRDERNTPEYLREGIANGIYDVNMRTICGVFNTLQSPVTLRWGHEMDDDNGQFIWAGWEPADYISAYRRMIDICRAEAPNITVMWSPLGDEGMELYYPGDDYADLVGLSVFGLQAWDQAKYGGDRSFNDILTPRYNRAAAFGKPIVVAELGYVGKAPYVEAWENSVRVAYPEYPNLVGVVYFNFPEVYAWPDGFGRPDWRVENRVLP